MKLFYKNVPYEISKQIGICGDMVIFSVCVLYAAHDIFIAIMDIYDNKLCGVNKIQRLHVCLL